ncbi:MAG: nucleotidyltransferase family protein [Bacteroidetes bacterium]|nr:nucleotidyltransferase family protein [Bacteroidota bacterium]
MKAMIFAAGLGTRLRPLTNNIPKALVPLNGIPLLELAIRRLKYYGFNEIIINVHHFAEKIMAFLEEKNNFDIEIHISNEEKILLDTGGGLKNAAWFLKDEPFLVVNADIVTSLNLAEMVKFHQEHSFLATLAVQTRESSRQMMFNDQNLLSGWKNHQTGEEIISRQIENPTFYSFSGIHVINPEIFELMPEEEIFPIMPFYLSVASNKQIGAFDHTGDIWEDVGKLNAIEKTEGLLTMISGIST